MTNKRMVVILSLVLTIACTVAAAAAATPAKRITEITLKMEALAETNAKLADLVEQEIRDGRWSDKSTELASNVAKTRRDQVKAAKTLIEIMKKNPELFEKTDQWQPTREGMIKAMIAEGDSIEQAGYSLEVRKAFTQCIELRLDLIKLMDPDNQDW